MNLIKTKGKERVRLGAKYESDILAAFSDTVQVKQILMTK